MLRRIILIIRKTFLMIFIIVLIIFFTSEVFRKTVLMIFIIVLVIIFTSEVFRKTFLMIFIIILVIFFTSAVFLFFLVFWRFLNIISVNKAFKWVLLCSFMRFTIYFIPLMLCQMLCFFYLCEINKKRTNDNHISASWR